MREGTEEGLTLTTSSDWRNKLYYGDNLDIMREFIADETVE